MLATPDLLPLLPPPAALARPVRPRRPRGKSASPAAGCPHKRRAAGSTNPPCPGTACHGCPMMVDWLTPETF